MQKLAQGFICKRSAVVYIEKKDADGRVTFTATHELYEMPTGAWQFGKGKDAKTVESIEQVMQFGEDIQTAVATWLKAMQNRTLPAPVIAGQPVSAGNGESVSGKLSVAITSMTPEMQARLLNVIEGIVGPVADSAAQRSEVNHYSTGYGQDQTHTPPGRVPFTLPDGARYVDPQNPSAGYLTPTNAKDESGKAIMAWHETPEFAELANQAGEAGAPLVRVNPNLEGALAEIQQERERAKA